MSKRYCFDYGRKFEEWEQLQEKLVQLFKEKDDSRIIFMEQGIQILTEIINVTEGVHLINFSERFEFIQKNKLNYTAFRQLAELFKEVKKKIAAKRIMGNK
ncbi:YpoC family protein [Psychrobacillus sp. FJAT-51614]|uniref:YpoC family protein n=1 Tax=Psychrobacillus mangrovi TaxID=3117745 RepID=A0ABU8F018_9BACI